jgi:hypothetical protein
MLNFSPKIALISLDSEFKTMAVGRHRIHMQQTTDNYLVDVYRGNLQLLLGASALAHYAPVLTISVANDFGYTEMVEEDGSYTWVFNTDTHPLQVSVGLYDIKTSTLSKSRMEVTFKPTYRGVTDEEATEIMTKILDRANLMMYLDEMPSVEYTRWGEFRFYLEEDEDDLALVRFGLEALVLKIQNDATLRDELDISDLEVEYF